MFSKVLCFQIIKRAIKMLSTGGRNLTAAAMGGKTWTSFLGLNTTVTKLSSRNAVIVSRKGFPLILNVYFHMSILFSDIQPYASSFKGSVAWWCFKSIKGKATSHN